MSNLVKALKLSQPHFLVAGGAGNISINTDTLTLSDMDLISTENESQTGKTGSIDIHADSIKMNSGRISSRGENWKSNGGAITLTTNTLELLDYAQISSSSGDGKAGNLNITANAIKLDHQNKYDCMGCGFRADVSGGEGGDIIIKTGALDIFNHMQISSSSYGNGNAGNIYVKAQSINIKDSDIPNVKAAGVPDGNGGINMVSFRFEPAGIVSRALDADRGTGGTITIDSPIINILNGGQISTATETQGHAGDINITTDSLLIDRQNSKGFTGIFSLSHNFNPYKAIPTGDAGNITINAASDININGNYKSTHKFFGGSKTGILSDAGLGSAGKAGNLTIHARNIEISKEGQISSDTQSPAVGDLGKAGNLEITATEKITLDKQASISSSTFALGNAGNVTVTAPIISMDNASIKATAEKDSSGNAGAVTMNSSNLSIFNGGTISSSTQSKAYGNAGTVLVNVDNLLVDGQHNLAYTGIFTDSYSNYDAHGVDLNYGDAESIKVTAKTLTLLDSGKISSSTWSAGKAGDVLINTNQLLISGVDTGLFAAAEQTSSGQTGHIAVNANMINLMNHGKISLQNDATVSNPTTIKTGLISISSPDIDLKDSAITAEATGNMDAGKININFSDTLTLDTSFISTSANSGNGGNITINGGQLISLQNSGFLTSVAIDKGNGGNINVSAQTLIMDNGVIQANAVGGAGGDINLNLKNLIPSQSNLMIGGVKVDWLPFQYGLNIIQAASQNGVSGTVNVTSPKFNISGSLTGLNSVVVLPILENNPCLNAAAYTSSLARQGKGGVATNEAKAVFIPAIAEQAHSTAQKSILSNALTLSANQPCAAFSANTAIE